MGNTRTFRRVPRRTAFKCGHGNRAKVLDELWVVGMILTVVGQGGKSNQGVGREASCLEHGMRKRIAASFIKGGDLASLSVWSKENDKGGK